MTRPLASVALRFQELSAPLRQTLQALMEGDSEKQAAARLGVSKHTIHGRVRELYARFGVNNRAELLALCLRCQRESKGMPRRQELLAGLPPSLRQTLALLMRGLSERAIATRFRLSRHTVHDQVKELYRRFEVNSRAELLAYCLRSGKPPSGPGLPGAGPVPGCRTPCDWGQSLGSPMLLGHR